ncbi:hypothetical protein STANM309S_03638 [Streptomyces tanashiensis]
MQPAALTALLGLLLAGGASLGSYGLLLPLVLLQGLTAAGWFRLNGMWPARQGIALAFLSRIILYGGNNNWFASYAYWYFKLYGHQDVKLLDGGRKKWELDSRDLVAEVPARPATEYKAKAQDASIRAFRDDVVAAIGAQNLVDVR